VQEHTNYDLDIKSRTRRAWKGKLTISHKDATRRPARSNTISENMKEEDDKRGGPDHQQALRGPQQPHQTGLPRPPTFAGIAFNKPPTRLGLPELPGKESNPPTRGCGQVVPYTCPPEVSHDIEVAPSTPIGQLVEASFSLWLERQQTPKTTEDSTLLHCNQERSSKEMRQGLELSGMTTTSTVEIRAPGGPQEDQKKSPLGVVADLVSKTEQIQDLIRSLRGTPTTSRATEERTYSPNLEADGISNPPVNFIPEADGAIPSTTYIPEPYNTANDGLNQTPGVASQPPREFEEARHEIVTQSERLFRGQETSKKAARLICILTLMHDQRRMETRKLSKAMKLILQILAHLSPETCQWYDPLDITMTRVQKVETRPITRVSGKHPPPQTERLMTPTRMTDEVDERLRPPGSPTDSGRQGR
jgi:hypothetical protein